MAKREEAERRESEEAHHSELLSATAREVSRAQKLTTALKRFLGESTPAAILFQPADPEEVWGPLPPRGRMH